MALNRIVVNGCEWSAWEVSDENMHGLIEWLNENANRVPDADSISQLFTTEEDEMGEIELVDDDSDDDILGKITPSQPLL